MNFATFLKSCVKISINAIIPFNISLPISKYPRLKLFKIFRYWYLEVSFIPKKYGKIQNTDNLDMNLYTKRHPIWTFVWHLIFFSWVWVVTLEIKLNKGSTLLCNQLQLHAATPTRTPVFYLPWTVVILDGK